MRTRVVWTLVAALAVGLLAPSVAHACPVCWGATDSPMAEGVNNGILFLLGVILAVQVGFVGLFVAIRHRSRRLEERRESFEMIDGGVR